MHTQETEKKAQTSNGGEQDPNTLYPIFLKLHSLELLIVGGGEAALEKVHFMLKNSPDARITLIAEHISEEVRNTAEPYEQVRLIERRYQPTDLIGKDLVVLATDDREFHLRARARAKERGILVNVADTPDLCDFYLGSIVTKGNLKVAISTNGRSPTLSKRLRQWFEEVLPDDISRSADQLGDLRDRIKGSLEEKAKKLDDLTRSFLN
jgi:precorrin-2 dehydrogenase/sirohydrochlorin ferrochelatase